MPMAEPCLEHLEYRDTYRDPKRLGEGKKSLLMTITLRWKEGTLTSQQADEIRDQVVAACRAKHARNCGRNKAAKSHKPGAFAGAKFYLSTTPQIDADLVVYLGYRIVAGDCRDRN